MAERARPPSVRPAGRATKMVARLQQQNMPARGEQLCTDERNGDDDEAGSSARNLPTAKERGERGAATALLFPRLAPSTTDDADVLVFTFAAPALARSPGPLIAAADADDDGEQERKKSEGRNRKETEKNFARSPIGRPGREHCQQRATATAENILRNLSPDEKRRRNSDKREISFNSTTRLTPPSLNATAENNRKYLLTILNNARKQTSPAECGAREG